MSIADRFSGESGALRLGSASLRAASRHGRRQRRLERGLSIVELMVGVAIGLFIVAGAATMVGGQLGENRRLMVETQLQQDLRAAADIITREIRRSGNWDLAHQGIWSPVGPTAAQPNSYAAITPETGAAAEIDFKYRRAVGQVGPYGFKLQDQSIRTLMGAAGWQELTDPNIMRVQSFSVTPVNATPIVLPCPNLCPGGSTDCWPQLGVRELDIEISASAASDPNVVRSLRTKVRLRNDWIRFTDAANPNRVCPE